MLRMQQSCGYMYHAQEHSERDCRTVSGVRKASNKSVGAFSTFNDVLFSNVCKA
jgi:hypothetical protein